MGCYSHKDDAIMFEQNKEQLIKLIMNKTLSL